MASKKTHGDSTAAADAAAGDCCSAGHSLSEAAIAADVETLATLGNDTRYECPAEQQSPAAAVESPFVCLLAILVYSNISAN